jgi:hypothetical protein
MRGGHAAPRSLRRIGRPAAAAPRTAAAPAPAAGKPFDPDATAPFTPDFTDRPAPPWFQPAGRTVEVDLTGTGALVSRAAPKSAPFTSDYRRLPEFRATLRAAGWCGLALRDSRRLTRAAGARPPDRQPSEWGN